jgi:trans-2,3-dihydro-3-hydroxyanthranilate isomerase
VSCSEDIVTTTHLPQVASVGLPLLFAELRDRSALARANMVGIDALVARSVTPDIHLYTHSGDDFSMRARMFAPLDGVAEDPATGSANCALAALLTVKSPELSGSFAWRIAQGVEMGRPSVLEARTEKRDGSVVGTWIGGNAVLVSEGIIEVD